MPSVLVHAIVIHLFIECPGISRILPTRPEGPEGSVEQLQLFCHQRHVNSRCVWITPGSYCLVPTDCNNREREGVFSFSQLQWSIELDFHYCLAQRCKSIVWALHAPHNCIATQNIIGPSFCVLR